MLDWSHRVALNAVEQGKGDDSPALRTLIAAGLAERREDGAYAVTDTGRVALERGRKHRWERIALALVSVCVAILAIDAIAGWLT